MALQQRKAVPSCRDCSISMKTKKSPSPTELHRYADQGYFVVPRLFSADDIRRIDHAINEIVESAKESDDFSAVLELEPETDGDRPVVRRIYNPFHQHDAFKKLATDARIMDRIEALIGENIELHHSKLNMKPAKVGSAVEWHQDLTYFPHTNDDLVTVLIYVDEATKENGCLQVLPKQHRGYLTHNDAEGLFAGMVTDDVASGEFGTSALLEGPAGSAIFMHCLAPHSSLPNLSSTGRRTIIFEYKAADSFEIQVSGGVKNTIRRRTTKTNFTGFCVSTASSMSSGTCGTK